MLNIIKYDNANALEATWLDAEGNQIASIAYADTQMDLLRSDVTKYGGSLKGYESLIAEVEAKIQTEVTQPVFAPLTVSMRQARLALLQSGLLSTVNAAIAAGSEADKITWEYATEVRRDDALVTNLSAALNLKESDLDNLFTLASSL
jgi:hypothetical protein